MMQYQSFQAKRIFNKQILIKWVMKDVCTVILSVHSLNSKLQTHLLLPLQKLRKTIICF